MGAIKWRRTYYAMLATPLSVLHLVAGSLTFAMFRVATAGAVFLLVLAPFGLFATWWGPILAFGSVLLLGFAVAAVLLVHRSRQGSTASRSTT